MEFVMIDYCQPQVAAIRNVCPVRHRHDFRIAGIIMYSSKGSSNKRPNSGRTTLLREVADPFEQEPPRRASLLTSGAELINSAAARSDVTDRGQI